jgi:hypothetical protein
MTNGIQWVVMTDARTNGCTIRSTLSETIASVAGVVNASSTIGLRAVVDTTL